MWFEHAYCLYVKGISLPESTLSFLLWGACQMAQRDEHESVFAIPDGKCVLTTNYEVGLMRHITGIAFKADIAVGSKQAQVSFLVRERDLEAITSLEHTKNYCMVSPTGGPHENN